MTSSCFCPLYLEGAESLIRSQTDHAKRDLFLFLLVYFYYFTCIILLLLLVLLLLLLLFISIISK